MKSKYDILFVKSKIKVYEGYVLEGLLDPSKFKRLWVDNDNFLRLDDDIFVTSLVDRYGYHDDDIYINNTPNYFHVIIPELINYFRSSLGKELGICRKCKKILKRWKLKGKRPDAA